MNVTSVNGTGGDLLSSNYALRKQTFIIPLTCHDLRHIADRLGRISYGGDIWELRVDLLCAHGPPVAVNLPPIDYVANQIDYLQQSSDLPILVTIRTVAQGGRFPDGADAEALDMMLLAVEKGCEYLDVEVTWPRALIDEVSNKKKETKIIASYHDRTGNIRWSDPTLQETYDRVDSFGDILKLSILATDLDDSYDLAIFVRNHREKSPKPILAVGMGQHGQLSRVTSPISLVTHPLLPFPSAPGQLSLAEVNQALYFLGQLPKKRFFIFGHNISHSLSPTIHNSAFKEFGLPHHYSIHQTSQIDDSVRDIVNAADFGGASVTFPHKMHIQPLLDSVSESAQLIGAVNTVIVRDGKAGRVLHGDNTDWIGIRNCILRSRIDPGEVALVIGAGGAARAAVFALQKLGVSQVVLVNRTRRTAQQLVSSFPFLKFEICERMSEVSTPVNLIVSCIPADDVTEEDISRGIFASGAGLLVEMSYRPPVSALMKVAGRRPSWTVFGGVDVLKEQAFAQFELWTGRKAPVQAIEDGFKEKC